MKEKVVKRYYNEKTSTVREVPSTFEAAEKIYGSRLDRRRRYAIIKSDVGYWEVCSLHTYTDSCSGCLESGDYGGNLHRYKFDQKARIHIGSGCHECGYHGKVRNSIYIAL